MSKAFIQKISLPFNPTRITGCQLWLDALDPFGNGSIQNSSLTLTSWVDKSSSARHATMFNGSSISYSPTAFNGKPALLFTQSQNMSAPAVAGTFPSIFTFFIIYQRTGGGSYDTLVTRTVGNIAGPFDFYTNISTGNFSRNIGSPLGYYDFNTTSGSNFTNVTTPSLYYANITKANGALDAFNFVTPADPSSGTLLGASYVDVATAIYIGTRADSVTRLTASVAEIIVYSTTPTAQQREQIEGYLAQKWGLTANLPPGHPGRTQTIYTSNYNAKNPGIATTPSPAMTNLPYTNLFSPTSSSIGACQLWLDGADTAGTGTPPANGTTVSTWVDKSGNGRNAVAVVAGTYSSAQKSITFSGTNYYNSSYTAAPTSETLFIVFNMTTSNNPFLIASSTCGGRVADPTELLVFTGGAICYTNGAATTSYITLGSNTLGVVVTDGTNNYVSLHGALMLSGPVSVSYTGGTTTEIGGALGANYLTNGYINEVIAYNSVLGTTQRQLVEGYLAWKWRLTSSLPSTHPFKSVPPGRPSQVAGIPLVTQITHPTVPGYLEFYQVTSNDWTTSWLPYLQKLFATNTAATASSTLGTITGTSVGFYVSSFLAPNGLIYLADNQNNPMGVITPTANGGTYSSTTVTGVGPATQYGDNYKGGGLASNGIIYLVNFGAPGIGTINTNTNVFTTNPFNVSPGSAAVAGGVLGPDGNIYCAPYVNLSQLFYFTPGANTINSFAISATVRYSKPFLAPNGKIYCLGSTKIVGVIDPIARTFTEVGTAANQQYGFMVLGGNGVVYAFPQNASGIGTLNLTTNAITANVIAGGTGYYGGILGPDGNIYLYQSSAGNIGILNTKTNSLSVLTSTSIGYICGVLAPNGNIYLGASSVIVFSGVSLIPTLNFCLTPYLNNGANRF